MGICGQSTATGTIIIKDTPTISLVSGIASPTICIGSSFAVPIRYSITQGVISSSVPVNMILSPASTLPGGVTFDPVTGIITGNPTQSGTFPYTITSDNGCGIPLSGIITVNPLQSISYLSGNINQLACQNTSIDPINLLTSVGVTSVTVSPPLPAGVTRVYDPISNIVTISGTPTAATGTIIYTISTQGGCGIIPATFSFTLEVRPIATITLVAGSGGTTQSVCQSSTIEPILFTIGGGATGVSILSPGLPPGLTLLYNAGSGVYSIQGNPPASGCSFTITTTGCITALPLQINITNLNTNSGLLLTAGSGPINQTICQTVTTLTPIQNIIYDIVGSVTGIVSSVLPVGVNASIVGGQVIISGTPTVSGVYNYTITTQPCSVVKTGVIKVSTPISIINEVVTDVSCYGENDGKISLDIIGGYSYSPGSLYAIQWSGPNGFQQNQTHITDLEPGQYIISGTDALGCLIPTMSYTVNPAIEIVIQFLPTSTNISCDGAPACAKFNISGGSGIFPIGLFTLELYNTTTSPPSWDIQLVPNNNYYNICGLQAGIYRLTVIDSKDCSSERVFTIYDYSSLSLDSITMDDQLCQNSPGKIRVHVASFDPTLSFLYNNFPVPFVNLGDGIYELTIINPTTPTGEIRVKNAQNCSVTITVSSATVSPDFEFTSLDFVTNGIFSVNESVQFTNLITTINPTQYSYVVWDFGDNTPFKAFNYDDTTPDANGDSFETVFHTYTTDGIYIIKLTVFNSYGCSKEIIKTIVIGNGSTMILPTAFSPNGDGINDMFRPSLLGLKEVSMYIYDGWGNLVYEVSSEVSLLTIDWGWNGIEIQNTEPINGDYRYYIKAKAINDKIIEKEGRFLLIK